MRTNEGALQLLAAFRWNHRGGQRTETGRDPIHGVVALSQPLDDRRAAGNGLASGLGEHHLGPPPGNGNDLERAHTR